MTLSFSTWQEWIAFFLGLLGIGINFCIYQQNDHKRMLIFKMSTDIVWGIHYTLLGQWSGLAITCLAVARSNIFLWQYLHGKDDKRFLVLFLFAGVGTIFLTWSGPASILPGVASVMAVVSYWQTKPRITRIITLVSAALMIVYDLNILSAKPADVSAVIGECISISSSAIGLLRYDRNKTAKA